MAQTSSTNVINFHDGANGLGIAGPNTTYNELFAGQGAYPDNAGNNIWNGFSQESGPEGVSGSYHFFSGNVGTTGGWPLQTGNPGNPYAAYNASYSTYAGWKSCTGSSLITTTGITSSKNSKASKIGNASSAALISGIQLAVDGISGDDGPAVSYCANGTPLFLLSESGNNASYDYPPCQETFTLGKVPVGTYGLFLYGASPYFYGGDNFQVRTNANTATNGINFSGHNGITNTLNTGSLSGSQSFIEGVNFVVFTNVTLTTSGSIYVYATPNTNQLGAYGVGGDTPYVTTNYTTNITLNTNSADWSTPGGLFTTNIITDVSTNYSAETDVNGLQLVMNPPITALLPTRAQNVYAGGTASFEFTPIFYTNTPVYYWQSIISGVTNKLSDTTLGDGAIITGSATTNLVISNVTSSEVGLYQCVLSNGVTGGSTNRTIPAPLTLLVSTADNLVSLTYNISDCGNDLNPPYNVVPPPFNMGAWNVMDGDLAQYENFGRGANGEKAPFVGPVGIVAKAAPGTGYTVATGLRFFTAGSHPESDPANYQLEGSADGVTWTHIAGAPLSLPTQRNWAGGSVDDSSDVLQEVDFANTTPYLDYRITFTNIVNAATASNGLQIAEIELLGTQDDTSVPVQLISSSGPQTADAGGIAVYTAEGFAGFGAGNDVSYQWDWVNNGVTVILTNGATGTGSTIYGAQTATLTISNVSSADMGYYECVITSPSSGATTSPAEPLIVNVGPPVLAATAHPVAIPLLGTFSPIAVTGYNQVCVIPSNFPYHLDWQSVSVTLTNGPALTAVTTDPRTAAVYYAPQPGYTFYEAGFNGATGGMPLGGSTLNNWTTTNLLQYPSGAHSYTLPYWTNWNSNCVFLGNFVSNGTYNGNPLGEGPYVAQDYTGSNTPINLVLNNANNYNALSFLVSAGNGRNCTNNLVIQYADGTSQTVNGVGFPTNGPYSAVLVKTNSPYTNTTVTPNATYAYTCQSQFSLAPVASALSSTVYAGGSFSTAGTTNARLWSVDIALNNTTSPPTNVILTYVSGSNGVVFAVSGSQNPADSATVPNTAPLTGPFAPITVSGFNAGCVVANDPAANKWAPITFNEWSGTNMTPVGFDGTDLIMAEQGWDRMAPNNGFPYHGSTITSGVNSNVTYTMASTYNSPMSFCYDVNNRISRSTGIQIQPVNTNVSYSSLSFLAGGGAADNSGNHSTYITNQAFIQHADGVNETATWYAYDWFITNHAPPSAWECSETVQFGILDYGELWNYCLDNISGLGYVGRLYDSVVFLSDQSPVTNIVVGYYAAATDTSNTYNSQFVWIAAVSGSPAGIGSEYPIELETFTPSQTVGSGGNAAFSISVNPGTYPAYQWQWVSNGVTYNLTDGATGTGSTISGSLTPSLTITTVSTNDAGYYTCLVTNAYPSSLNSPVAALQVLQETPQIDVDVSGSYAAVLGYPVTMKASVSGSTPITYQWTYNGNPISGATSSALTISSVNEADAGTYQLLISNSFGSTASSQAVLTVESLVAFNNSIPLGSSLTLTGGGIWLNSGTVELTDGGGDETVSAFFGAPVDIGEFQADFTYTDVGGTVFDANGACFVLQNAPAGASAQGSGSTGLGYGGITNSFAVEINLNKAVTGGCGITYGTNGSVTKAIATEGNITNSLTAGDPINVTVLYDGATLSVTLVDSVSNSVTFSSSIAINLTNVLKSSQAYVGFTAATAHENTSVQTISNFKFQSIERPGLSGALDITGTNIVMSWPSGMPCQLQVSSDLITWVNVTNAVTVANGTNQVTVPMSGTQQFFRLLEVQ